MLSEKEYQDTLWKLDNIPSTITGKQRRNLRVAFRKKLKEHQYASKYEPFQPLPHTYYYINRTTPDITLHQIIQIAQTTSNFTLDTESVNIYKQGNKPVLVQVQMLLEHNSSIVLIFEMCHLPRKHELTFKLIQDFFNIIFNNDKTIYIWGIKDELLPFTVYDLFSYEQINRFTFINLQDKFKEIWQQQHPHQSSELSNNSINDCLCESCIGKASTELWSLQDAVIYQLHEWLDKRVTNSPFDIGLDLELCRLNSAQKEYRQYLTKYAANDCLSMQRLIIHMELDKSHTNETSTIPPPINEHDQIDELESISSDDNPSTQQNPSFVPTNPSINEPKHRKQLTSEEKRQIHNRSCTLKQRKRLYKHEIIRRGIDRRFTITDIKQILRQHSIKFCAVNITTSSVTHRTSLYIGIKNSKSLSKYEHQTRNLFSSDQYDQLYSKQHRRHHYYKQN